VDSPSIATPARAAPKAKAGSAFRPPADATTTASGLRLVVQRGAAAGLSPTPYSAVVMHYTVRDGAGELVRKTDRTHPPETVELAWLPPGWAEGMQLLAAGDRATMWLPAALAYGEGDHGPAGPLVIEVELVEVIVRDTFDPTTLPISAAPPEAETTASGIAYLWIARGEGTRSPALDDRISVHYTGWTTDGHQFDSSHSRDAPLQFTPRQVIAGWTEILGLMVEGDKLRCWIPQQLAYGGQSGKPAGTLVFDIELLAFAP
jgi:peptidylprolyl isomerase